jgi:rhodanese-related sulfurtransferase
VRFPFSRPSVPEMSVDELAATLGDRRVHILDVRERSEFASGRVPGAVHLPLSELSRRVTEVPTGRPIAVICASGSRSRTATRFLLDRGIADAASVKGGTGAWARSGRKLVRN